MKLIGTLRYLQEDYFLYLNDTKNKEIWYLVSMHHKDDIVRRLLNQEVLNPVISSVMMLDTMEVSSDYLLEGVSRAKVSGKVESYNRYQILEKVLSTFSLARSYNFAKNVVLEDERKFIQGKVIETFHAIDPTLEYKICTENKIIKELKITYRDLAFNLNMPSKVKISEDVKFSPVTNEVRKRVLLSSVSSVDYNTLKELLDMSWYEDESGLKKDYRSIKTIEEFENYVMKDIFAELKACKARGEDFILAVDTETNGLNICNLSKDNEDKHRVVAIPIAWKDNQGVTIFVDMEYFENVPLDYVINRLRFLMESEDDVTITINGVVKDNLTKMDFFSDDKSAFTNINTITNNDVFSRRDIRLIGHNVMFDGKVFYDCGIEPYWNEDTLVMAFNLNPKVSKGTNKLKNLTRNIFGHETPELDDILGKGNEDKYRYISDEQVAIIYGCADSDYTRLVYKKLRSLMNDFMYRSYQRQDIPMLNMLYVSEYYGLNMDAEKVAVQADMIERDLEIIREFLHSYVGMMVEYKNKSALFRTKFEVGLIDIDEYKESIKGIKIDKNATYRFDLTGANIRDVLFNKLEYPVQTMTAGKNPVPAVDKNVMKRLMQHTNVNPANFLRNDIMSSSGNDVLISAKKFNKYKFPMAYVLSIYAELYKEYTSYYKPIKETNLEGKLFKGYSLTRIETRRIMNPSQTMKGSLKILTKAYTKDHYLCDFDMSQVEYRIMVSLAKFTKMIETMKDPEKDYHTETASLVHDIPAHKVSKKMRKQTKGISFGVPYGLGDFRLSMTLFNDASEDSLFATRKLLEIYKQNNRPVIDLIDGYRDKALEPVNISRDLRDFLDFYVKKDDGGYELDAKGEKIPAAIGMINNLMGFYRFFNLENLDRKKIGQIRRPAGNYPIQSFAAELFRMILIRFRNKLKEEGLLDKVIFHMLIHDELLMSVHKSIHPFRLYKIIKDACMITIKGHTKYFVGINIGDNWYDCKDDKSEAPIYFVDRMINRYEVGEFKETWIDDPKSYVRKYKDKYIEERIYEVLKELQPDIDNAPIDLVKILEHFSNYTVRAYVSDFYKCNSCICNNLSRDKAVCSKCYEDSSNEDKIYICKLESWILQVFGVGKEIKYADGTIRALVDGNNQESQEVELELKFYDNLEEDSEGSYWTFEDGDLEQHYVNYVEFAEDEDKDPLGFELKEFDENAKTVADMIIGKTRSYKYVQVVNEQFMITLSSSAIQEKIKSKLISYEDPKGYSVLFKTPLGIKRWIKLKKDLSLDTIESIVKEVS